FFMPVAKIVFGAAFLIPVAAPFLYAVFKAVEWRWWLSGIRFGGVRLESSLTRGALIGLYWKVIGWLLLLGVLLSAYVYLCIALVAGVSQIPMAKLFAPGNLQGSIPVVVLVVIGYLAFILTANVVMRVYLLRYLWARVM